MKSFTDTYAHVILYNRTVVQFNIHRHGMQRYSCITGCNKSLYTERVHVEHHGHGLYYISPGPSRNPMMRWSLRASRFGGGLASLSRMAIGGWCAGNHRPLGVRTIRGGGCVASHSSAAEAGRTALRAPSRAAASPRRSSASHVVRGPPTATVSRASGEARGLESSAVGCVA